MLNLFRWFRERRWKHLAVALSFVISGSVAGKVLAKTSPKTKEAQNVAFQIVERNEGKNWTKIEEEALVKATINLIRNLRIDVIASLDAGNYEDASKEYRKMIELVEVIGDLGTKEDIQSIEKDFAAVAAAIDQFTKKKKKGKGTLKENLPEGTYIFQSKNFFLYLEVKETKKGKLVVREHGGFPLEEGEWEEASEGKPEAVKAYVLEKVLRVKDESVLK